MSDCVTGSLSILNPFKSIYELTTLVDDMSPCFGTVTMLIIVGPGDLVHMSILKPALMINRQMDIDNCISTMVPRWTQGRDE